MNILFITIAWPSSGNRNLYSDLLEEFAQRGHKVFVAATHADLNFQTAEEKLHNGIRIVRIPTGKIRKTSALRKAISLLTLGRKLRKTIKLFYKAEKFDLIISPTPPITLSRLFKKLKKQHNAQFYLLLKDIWPQGSVDLKVFKKYSLPWLYLRKHEISTYKVADRIGTMSQMNVSYLLEKNHFLPAEKVEVCPNSIKPSASIPEADKNIIRKKYNIPSDACVFLFSGNLGRGHGLDFLVRVMQELSSYPKAFFVIGGSGTHFDYLEKKIKEKQLDNVFLYNWLPREDFENMLATSDVGLILLDKRYTVPQFPSRLLSYLDAAKPVLCAVNENTDIGEIVIKAKCGKSLIHGDINAFKEAVRFFAENPQRRLTMGENSRKLLLERYTVEKSYEIILNSHY